MLLTTDITPEEHQIESARGHKSAPQRCVEDGRSSKSQRSRSCPQSAGTPGRLRPEKPPSRSAEDCPRGPQPAASRVPGDISGKPTGPPAASHPQAGRARDPATRDPGVTSPAGDRTEPRDTDPTRQPPGIIRQTPKILKPLTREPRTLRQTKAPHSTPGVAGGEEAKMYSSKRSPRRGEESKAPPDIYSHTQTQSHTLPPSYSPYTPYSLRSRYCCTRGTTITGSQS
nr:translation initiation factor IF-2-like [Nothobranchius furzeri]